MIRLLIALAAIGFSVYFLLNQQKATEKPEVIYKQELDKVKGLEQQMLDDAQRQMKDIDSLTR